MEQCVGRVSRLCTDSVIAGSVSPVLNESLVNNWLQFLLSSEGSTLVFETWIAVRSSVEGVLAELADPGRGTALYRAARASANSLKTGETQRFFNDCKRVWTVK